MSKKIDQIDYTDEPFMLGDRVVDNFPKGKTLHSSKVRIFKKDGSIEESIFDQIGVNFPASKKSVTVRFDQDVIDYFKSLGSGYQSKMNAVLKAFVEHEKHRPHH